MQRGKNRIDSISGSIRCRSRWFLCDLGLIFTKRYPSWSDRRGRTCGASEKDGCVINDTVYHPEVWAPQEAHNVDLLIVCLKYGSLQGALDSIKEIVGEHTTVMSLMKWRRQ